MGCPLRNPSLFTLKFDSLPQFYFLKQLKASGVILKELGQNLRFSVKSEVLTRVQTPSYT